VTLTKAVPDGLGISGPGRDVPSGHTDGSGRADAPPAGPETDRELPGGGIDIGWGDRADGVRQAAYDGSILSGGLRDMVTGPEPDVDVEAEPMTALGDPLVRPDHMLTGQLTLISLLMGLGIAVLRIRRR
jgi:hypothetical protein